MIKSRTYVAGMAAALVLAGCSGLPDDTTDQDVVNYQIAVASIGCEMKYESDYLPVELQAGLTREQTLAISSYMVATDRAVRLPEGGVKLTTGACA